MSVFTYKNKKNSKVFEKTLNQINLEMEYKHMGGVLDKESEKEISVNILQSVEAKSQSQKY